MNFKSTKIVAASLALAALFASCGGNGKKANGVKSKRAGINEVIIHISADPDKLNSITSTAANASEIERNIFASLLDNQLDSPFAIIPGLAKARPTIEEINEGELKGGLKITYELRDEAKWDNGSPVTVDDILFTLKAIKNPKVDCEHLRSYYDFIQDVVTYPDNNKKFTFLCKGKYFQSEVWSAITPFPEYVYDPEKIMRKFDYKIFNNPKEVEKLKGNPDIIRFAEQFNSEKFAREPEGVSGAGPYALEKWITGQRVILKKKQNYWGEKFVNENPEFYNLPDKLIFEIINDQSAALAAVKGENIDVASSFKAKDFIELEKDEKLTAKYRLEKPNQLLYSYLGLNMRDPKTSDVRVRRALAHLIDIDQIIEKISYGMATRVVGPTSPQRPYYNSDLKLIPFDIAEGNRLLDQAGWKDTDGDGIRDKMINGKKIKLSLTFKIPSGNETAERILLLYQENCKKAGVEIAIAAKEWTVFLDEIKAHNFDAYLGQWISHPLSDDPKQIWHTSSYNGGSNYVGFGDQKSDEVIDKLRYELDENKRNELYKEFQRLVYEAQPYIFMSSPLNRVAIHKRFSNGRARVCRPGYLAKEFKLDPDFGK